MSLSGEQFRLNVLRGHYRCFSVACGGVRFSISRPDLINAVCFDDCIVDFTVEGKWTCINSINYIAGGRSCRSI